MDWPPSHCGALKEFVAKGMSYRDAADAPNAEFGTAWSRSTAPGRAWRIGLPGSGAPKSPALVTETRIQQGPRPGSDESALRELLRGRRPVFQRLEGVRLRCVEVDPRHLELVDLERDDCRYPYGGDEEGEAITFCGRPRRQGSSYCTPHFHLTRNTDVPAGRPASAAPLRLVVAV